MDEWGRDDDAIRLDFSCGPVGNRSFGDRYGRTTLNADHFEELNMTHDFYMAELFKAKRALEDMANDAEEHGFKVKLNFQQDMMQERHKGRPHGITITLSKEIV